MKTEVGLTAIFALSAIATLAWQIDTAKSEVVTEGLVSYWTFDKADIEGDTVKDVWGENDGTIMGDPQIVEGKVGEALQFDGSGDYVEAPDDESLQLWETYTLEAWVYQTNTVPTDARIIDKITAGTADGPHLDTHPTGTKLRSCAGACINNDTDRDLEAWYHVVMTFDNGDVKFYLDGSPDGGGVAPSPLSGNSLSLKIGTDSNTQLCFSGIIDEVRVYNRALSEDEVKQNMKAEGLAVASSANKLALTWGAVKVSR